MVNVKPVKLGKNTRMSFSKIEEVLKMPNLIEVQKDSYGWFLHEGLKEVWYSILWITSWTISLITAYRNVRNETQPTPPLFG